MDDTLLDLFALGFFVLLKLTVLATEISSIANLHSYFVATFIVGIFFNKVSFCVSFLAHFLL